MSGRTSDSRTVAGSAILLAALLFANGCATWSEPVDPGVAPLRARAVTQTSRNVRVSATVLNSDDSVRLLGTDVTSTGVQPVWIEVENDTSQYLALLHSGTDPDYFSPLEVAWSTHTTFGGDTNDRIDEYFDSMAFRNPVPPGGIRSGLVFTNPQPVLKLLNVDLLGNREMVPFTLFVPAAGESTSRDLERFRGYAAREVPDYQNLDDFRAALAELTCCAEQADGAGGDAPVNVFLVGKLEDIAAGVVRRGYRRGEEPSDAMPQLFGRSAGLVVRKTAQAGAPAVWLRVWLAPLRFRGQAVFAVQAGRPNGGRFASNAAGPVRMHPAVDEARNYIVGDMFYCGGLARLGFVKGPGAISRDAYEQSEGGARYYSDGLRSVLFFETRPRSFSDVELLPWEVFSPRIATTTGQVRRAAD